MIKTVNVSLGERSYPVHIGAGLIANVMDYIPAKILAGQNIFILTDDNAINYADQLQNVLEQKAGAANVHVMAVPSGESSKSFDWYEKILTWMLNRKVARKSVLFTVGGGVVGDLGGFAAATVLRGIGFIQVPTTILAQVDSSIGGKTAIDTPQGKNLVGAFYQPLAVLCDTDTLHTLDMRQRLAGYAEIIKYGLINDAEFFEWLEKNGKDVCALKGSALIHAIETACRKKAEIVAADERESGARMLLNLGHTFGHALEASTGYSGDLIHGEAVAVGMVMAIDLSKNLGHCGDGPKTRLLAHLKSMGLPSTIHDLQNTGPFDPNVLLKTMYADKKAETGGLTFILLNEIGKTFVQHGVAEDAVMTTLNHSIQGE